MSVALRCLSSKLTTQLALRFRNEHGSEENWTDPARRKNNFAIYYVKVIVTELALSILCVTSLIEAIAYGILVVASLPLLCLSKRPSKFAASLLSSSGFTLYWNLANLFVVNPFFTNLNTHESLARVSMDLQPRGAIIKCVMLIGIVVLHILAVIFRFNLSPNLADKVDNKFIRPEDELFVLNWYRTLLSAPTHSRGLSPSAHRIYLYGQTVDQRVTYGAEFFKKYILNNPKINESTKKLIVEGDAEMFELVTSYTVYLYAFGSLRQKLLPSFFKLETMKKILELRDSDLRNDGKAESEGDIFYGSLEKYMTDLALFLKKPAEKEEKQLFLKIKTVAYGELQGIFTKNCWNAACIA